MSLVANNITSKNIVLLENAVKSQSDKLNQILNYVKYEIKISDFISFDFYSIQDIKINLIETDNSNDDKFRLEIQSNNDITYYQTWSADYASKIRYVFQTDLKKWINAGIIYNTKNKVKFTPSAIIDTGNEQYFCIIYDYAIENNKPVFYIYRTLCLNNYSNTIKFSKYNNMTITNVKLSIDSFLSDIWGDVKHAANDVYNAGVSTVNYLKNTPVGKTIAKVTGAIAGAIVVGGSYVIGNLGLTTAIETTEALQTTLTADALNSIFSGIGLDAAVSDDVSAEVTALIISREGGGLLPFDMELS